MVCFTDEPFFDVYEDVSETMPLLERVSNDDEEEQLHQQNNIIIIDPVNDDDGSEEGQQTGINEQEPSYLYSNEYEEYIHEMLEYYRESDNDLSQITRQSVLSFELHPQLSRTTQRQVQRQQVLSEIIYENLRSMFSLDD